jgi:hypothetical protein
MSITKLKSYTTRNPRDGEIPDHTYYFTNKEKLKHLHNEDKLMQFIELNNELYGYAKSEFENIDKLVIVVAPSGAGKDTSFDFIETHFQNEFKKNVKYLFSIPLTVKIFVNYCKKNNIEYQILHLFVDGKERLRRIVKSELFKLTEFIDSLDNDNYGKVLKVVIEEDYKIYILGMIEFELICFNDKKDISEVIDKSLSRFNRDNILFKEGIPQLQKKYNINILDVNSLNIKDTSKKIVESIRNYKK